MSAPEATLYERIGGAEGIERLVAAHVAVLESSPECSPLRALHGEVIDRYAERLAEFLSGWLGGPALYLERHGIPMLRESHRRIPIDEELAELWMHSMRCALERTVLDDALHLELEGVFGHMASSLVVR